MSDKNRREDLHMLTKEDLENVAGGKGFYKHMGCNYCIYGTGWNGEQIWCDYFKERLDPCICNHFERA